ncbi:MAG: hypothetical protein AB7G93_13850 [Bdellovibrionales bacterium]
MRWLLLLSAFLSACAQLEVNTPNPRVEAPEVRGERYRWKVGAALLGTHVLKSTENGGARPPNFTEPDVHNGADVAAQVQFAPLSRAEIGAELYPMGRGAGMILRWQVIGEGSDSAGAGNFPLGVYIRAGRTSGTKSGDQKETFGPGGYNWRGEIHNPFVHVGASLGYRPLDRMLIYMGAAGGRYWARSRIEQDAADGGADPGGTYTDSLAGTGETYGVGLQWNWPALQISAGLEFSRIDYEKAQAMEDSFIHAGLHFTP